MTITTHRKAKAAAKPADRPLHVSRFLISLIAILSAIAIGGALIWLLGWLLWNLYCTPAPNCWPYALGLGIYCVALYEGCKGGNR